MKESTQEYQNYCDDLFRICQIKNQPLFRNSPEGHDNGENAHLTELVQSLIHSARETNFYHTVTIKEHHDVGGILRTLRWVEPMILREQLMTSQDPWLAWC